MAGIHEYFSFSKRERIGVIVLTFLIAVIFLSPELIPRKKSYIDANAQAEIRSQISLLKSHDSAHDLSRLRLTGEDVAPHKYPKDHATQKSLFRFDPNTLPEDGWRKLGISERTTRTIRNYISKGGQFRKPEDLRKIYGIRKDQYYELLPYIRIPESASPVNKNKYERFKAPEFTRSAHAALSVVELNSADTSMLIALPGIGSKLASRILNFRNKLGGFYSIDQVKEVYGLQDSTFQKVKPYLKCDSLSIQQININIADLATLRNHPYIKWNIANAIVNYRLQHGEYKSIESVLQIDIISRDIFQKLIPYLKVN